MGLVKVAEDDVESSVEPFRKCVEIAENQVNLTLLAQSLLKVNPKDSEAEAFVDKAIKMKGDYYPARLQKALVLSSQGKYEDAFMELHNIPDNNRTPDWFLVEGDIYKKQGDGPAALASWRESVRMDPHAPDSYKHMAEYYANRGEGNGYCRDARRVGNSSQRYEFA